MKKYFVHAANVNGLGAINVTKEIICLLVNDCNLERIFVSQSLYISLNDEVKSNKKIINIGKSDNKLNRIIDILFAFIKYPKLDCIVLGDIPLNLRVKQNIYLHNPNLVNSKYSNSLPFNYRLNKFIFKILYKLFFTNINTIFLQSNHMEKNFRNIFHNYISRYPIKFNKNLTPLSDEFKKNLKNIINSRKSLNWTKGLILFYPSAYYPHKNHKFLLNLLKNKCFSKNIKKIIFTISENDLNIPTEYKKYIAFLGNIKFKDVIELYKSSHILFFPSYFESLGLPLIEANAIGMPILAKNEDYSQEFCKKEYLFNNEDDFFSKLMSISNDNSTKDYSSYSWKKLVNELTKF